MLIRHTQWVAEVLEWLDMVTTSCNPVTVMSNVYITRLHITYYKLD